VTYTGTINVNVSSQTDGCSKTRPRSSKNNGLMNDKTNLHPPLNWPVAHITTVNVQHWPGCQDAKPTLNQPSEMPTFRPNVDNTRLNSPVLWRNNVPLHQLHLMISPQLGSADISETYVGYPAERRGGPGKQQHATAGRLARTHDALSIDFDCRTES